MASVLTVYNAALRHCGLRKLASASEAVESRRALDDAYDDALRFMLERGFWNFAVRTIEMSAPTVTPIFGFNYAHEKPADWRRTLTIAADDRLSAPIRFVDEAGYWNADYETIYVRYISDDASYGGDLTKWPQSFAEAFSSYLALQVVERLTQSDTKIERIAKLHQRSLSFALSRDAMDEPPGELPRGGWASSRSQSSYRSR